MQLMSLNYKPKLFKDLRGRITGEEPDLVVTLGGPCGVLIQVNIWMLTKT